MVTYFKELEDKNICLKLLKRQHIKDTPYNEFFTKEQLEKIALIFKKIKEYDLLEDKNIGTKNTYYIDRGYDFETEEGLTIEDEYWDYMNSIFIQEKHDTYFTPLGIEKMQELEKQFTKSYKGNRFNEEFEDYFFSIINYMCFSNINNKRDLKSYLRNCMYLAKVQGKLSNEDKKLFEEVINNCDLKLEIPYKEYEPYDLKMPNFWYITPYNHLYNSFGINAHSATNLVAPFYYEILENKKVGDGRYYLNKIRKIEKEGYIERWEFDCYTNLSLEITSILPEEYYYLDDDEKFLYRYNSKRTYNRNVCKHIIGIYSAHAGLYNFF